MHILLEKYFSLIKSFLPKPKEIVTSAIGLDIGQANAYFVEIDRDDDGYIVKGWGAKPIMADDQANTVRVLFEGYDHSNENIYTAIAGKGTLIRYINMPQMSIDDAKSSFSIESEKYFPFNQNQIFTDCYVLQDAETDKNINLLAAAAKKEMVNDRIALLQELDISSDFIGINSIALANAISVFGTGYKIPLDSAIGILDMGASVSSLTIMYNNKPQFSRDIFIGGNEMTKRVGNTLGIESEAAENLKVNPQGRTEDVLTACESPLSNIMQEIRLSFDYFTSEKNIDVTHLIIAGGTSQLSRLKDIFHDSLEIDVQIWNPTEKLKFSDNVDKAEFQKNLSNLGVALGLALYHYD